MTTHPVKRRKKLIEVAIPLEAINAASAREKSIRHGHPSTLHLWWARRPLAAARAVQWCSGCLQSKGNLENLFQALADRRAWQKVIDEKKLLNLTENQKEQAIAKIEQATTAIAARIPETWCHLLVPYQSEPGPHGPSWDERRLSGGKGSLAERAAEKCCQEDHLASEFGARTINTIRDKLNAFLWRDRDHVEVRELVDWCRKYLFLPRISSDQVILNALVNPQAAVSGENTFHLADSVDEATCRYSELRPQQRSSNQLPTLNSLVVKDEVALAQLEHDRQEAERRKLDPPTGQTSTTTGIGSSSGSSSGSGSHPHNTTGAGSGTCIGLSPVGGGGSAVGGGVVEPPKLHLPSRYVASVKLDPTRASLQMSAFVEEVMSHLQARLGAQIEMTLEVQVNAPGGIDESTARIVLENSAALKVEKPGLY